jgi:hypothetical protein
MQKGPDTITILAAWLTTHNEYCERIEKGTITAESNYFTAYAEETRKTLKELIALNDPRTHHADKTLFTKTLEAIETGIGQAEISANAHMHALKKLKIETTENTRSAFLEETMLIGSKNQKNVGSQIFNATMQLLQFAESKGLLPKDRDALIKQHNHADKQHYEKLLKLTS